MVRFLGSGRSCAVLAILMTLAAGCGTGRAHAAPAGQPRSPRPHPAPSATGIVKRADSLTGVACLPAGTCVAVGWYYYGATGPSLTLAIRWNGRAWLAVPAPSHGHDSQLDDVSCATATSCLADGLRRGGVLGERRADARRALERRHLDHSTDPEPHLTAASLRSGNAAMRMSKRHRLICGAAHERDAAGTEGDAGGPG
jgi:hypothetical protein